MQWTKKGAHFMLQTRTKVLNGDLKMCFKKMVSKYEKLKKEKLPIKSHQQQRRSIQ